MKVLHLPTDTGGNSWGLSRGERDLGIQSEVLVERTSYFNYPGDINLNLDKKSHLFPQKLYKVDAFLRKLTAFLKIRNKYNIFHFNFGKSLLHSSSHPIFYQFELPFYSKNAKLFVTYNGSDARQGSQHLEKVGVQFTEEENLIKKKCIEKMASYVDWIWAVNPDLLNFLPKEKSSFLPYSIANFKVDPSFPKINGKLKIVHAPTDRRIKGTQFILKAIEKLEKKYPEHFEFRLIENLSNEKALEIYREADLVIDQLMIGWYGAFAVEVMLMGKPVVVFIEENDLKSIPKGMRSDLLNTVINANPLNIYETLEMCLTSRKILQERAAASIEYAARWHHPREIARITKEKYEQKSK